MEQRSHSALPSDLGFNFREIFGTLWRRRWVIGGTVLLVTSIAVLVAFQVTPRYTATAEVLVDPRERKVADVEAVLSGLSSDVSTIDSQIQVIRSRSLAARVIQQLGLQDDPEFNSRLRKPGVAEEILNSIRRLVFTSRAPASPRKNASSASARK